MFGFGFFLPFLLTLSNYYIKGIAFTVILWISNIGLFCMYILEIIAIRVEGTRKYISDKWNFSD